MDVDASARGPTAERCIEALVEMGNNEKVRGKFFDKSKALGTIDILCVADRNATPPGPGRNAASAGEKTQEFCKGGDEPDVDRVDYSAAGEESDGTSEEACIFEHDPAASDDAHHLEGFVLKKRVQDGVAKKPAATKKNSANRFVHHLGHSLLRLDKAVVIWSSVWLLERKKRRRADFSLTAG